MGISYEGSERSILYRISKNLSLDIFSEIKRLWYNLSWLLI